MTKWHHRRTAIEASFVILNIPYNSTAHNSPLDIINPDPCYAPHIRKHIGRESITIHRQQ